MVNFQFFKLANLFKHNIKSSLGTNCMKIPGKPPWKVLFFGTDEFSIFSLKELCQQYRKRTLIDQLEVVTTVKGKPNPVRVFSEKENLRIHKWPIRLDRDTFDVGLVVSFGHLIPEEIIKSFKYGMLNVHASLLPRWRGAAPIIYALANGDTQTGVTIMTISPHKFDVGSIVAQESIEIGPNIRMPQLYQQLGLLGAYNLINVLEELPHNLSKAYPQPSKGVTYAPKVQIDFACIKWSKMSARQIYNLERALTSLYPLYSHWKGIPVKLVDITISDEENTECSGNPGFVEYDKCGEVLRILCADLRYINVKTVGVSGKRSMSAKDFNNGYIKKEAVKNRYFK